MFDLIELYDLYSNLPFLRRSKVGISPKAVLKMIQNKWIQNKWENIHVFGFENLIEPPRRSGLTNHFRWHWCTHFAILCTGFFNKTIQKKRSINGKLLYYDSKTKERDETDLQSPKEKEGDDHIIVNVKNHLETKS